MQEPSVLDYVKSRLMPWKGNPIRLPEAELAERPDEAEAAEGFNPPARWAEAGAPPQPAIPTEAGPNGDYGIPQAEWAAPVPSVPASTVQAAPVAVAPVNAWPWRSMLAIVLALIAQRSFAPPNTGGLGGAIFLGLAVVWAAWAYWKGEWKPARVPEAVSPEELPAERRLIVNPPSLGLGLLTAGVAFLASSGNRFSLLNLGLMGLSLFFLIQAFWLPSHAAGGWRSWAERLQRRDGRFTVSGWGLVVLAAVALVVFFRFYRLGEVPPEMVSDHAEKYLDVLGILQGEPRIFFPRNGGREALQFYLLAALHRFGGLPLDHLTLKISTSLVGLLALPFLYGIGKEIANRRVALLAFTFGGIAYWTNVVARAGMRLPFYMLFTGAVLYFLLRGIRRGSRNDFILAGIALGLGFYGYSADRILPLMVIAAVGLYLIHRHSSGQRIQTLWSSAILALMAFVLFLPLLRYITQDPQGFAYRMASRMGTLEQPLPGPAWQIFLDNLWRALKMFSISGGVVWGVSIPDYPALGVVTGALFYLGAALLLFRYLRRRHWLDLFLLISIPILMLPSILALAFPSENPNLYRTGGAMIPVFLMVGLAVDGLLTALETRLQPQTGRLAAAAALVILLGWAAVQEYNLVFERYYEQYRLAAWNYREVGQVIEDFGETLGSPDTVWIMGYPYWIDTRLAAITAADAYNMQHDYAMFPEQLGNTVPDPRPKLFILHPDDQAGLEALQQTYPQGWLTTYASEVETKSFGMYFVPPAQ